MSNEIWKMILTVQEQGLAFAAPAPAIFGLTLERFGSIFYDRKNIPSRILEPRDLRTIASHYSFGVGSDFSLIIFFQPDTERVEFVYRFVDVVHRKVENRESRGGMIGFWI